MAGQSGPNWAVSYNFTPAKSNIGELTFSMRGTKESYLKKKADKKLVMRRNIFQALIILMFVIVLYDSFINKTPFYYICFLLLGLLVGRIVSIADRVKHGGENGKFTLDSNIISLVIILVLLSFRFFLGRYVLDLAHVVWTTDALYLIFIGIYWSKLKSMISQMDDIIYGLLGEKK